MCEQETTDLDIGKAINRATSSLVDLTIGIVNVKFDEEPLTGDEWLHMMQHKEHIDMLLFGEKIPLVYGNQVEDIMFVVAEVGKMAENENYDAMIAKEGKEGRGKARSSH